MNDSISRPTGLLLIFLAIVFTVLTINLLGDGLRDALDPKMEEG